MASNGAGTEHAGRGAVATRGAAVAVAIAVMAATVAACSTAPPRRPAPGLDAAQAWAERRSLLERLDEWSLTGRIAVDNGQESWSAQLWWRQAAESYTIAFRSPLGQQVARLQGGAHEVTLYAPGRDPVTAPDPAELLAGYVGWPVPVAGLRYWVRGLPEGDAATARSWDGLGRLNSLEQSGWHVEFQRYAAVEGLELPTRILLAHPRLRVRMVIDHWEIDHAPAPVPAQGMGGAR